MAGLLAAFASCTQDDVPGSAVNTVPANSTLTVGLPDRGLRTRALPTAENHFLRCILEVWSQGDAPALQYRQVLTAGDADDGGTLTFNFDIDPGTYDCLLWADFVATGTGMEEGTYYDAGNLRAVSLKDPALMFNTDACDAFCARQVLVKEEMQQLSEETTLQRALAKVVVSDKIEGNLTKVEDITVSVPVPGTFNVLTGETSQSLTATAQDVPVLGDGVTDGRLFSLYMFVPQPAEGETEPATLGDVDITISQTDGTEKTVTIPEGSIPVQQDYQSNVSGGLVEPIEDNFGLTVDFADDWSDQDEPVTPGEPVVEPKVGDFYYSDGTWSSTLNAGKTCIGIVFSTDASKFDDNIDNYAGSGLTGGIKGYVVALENVRAGKGTLFPAGAAEAAASLNLSDLSGYVNTQALLENELCTTYAGQTPLLDDLESYQTNHAAPAATSGWYIPSQAQMVEVAGLYTGYEGGGFTVTANDAFKAAVDALNADPDYAGDDGYEGINISTGALNMATSTITAGATQAVQAGSAEGSTPPYWNIRLLRGFAVAGTFSGNLRPILTF